MNRQLCGIIAAFFNVLIGPVLLAGPIAVPNSSFELPVTGFVNTTIDSWQKTPSDPDFDTSGGFTWFQLSGTFKNTSPAAPDHLDNCDSNQAAYVFADRKVGLFQDYDSIGSNETNASHAFNATFNAGSAYIMTLGINGGGGGMKPNTTLELSFYYRDDGSNMQPVAVLSITNNLDNFPTHTHLRDYTLQTPVVKASAPWAGRHIGVQIYSSVTTTNQEGGYWDIDNLRLASVLAPILTNAGWNGGQFQFTINGESGRVEILGATNVADSSGWTSLGIVTNLTGSILFTDTNTIPGPRFLPGTTVTAVRYGEL